MNSAAGFQAEILNAIAHPNRIRILEKIRSGLTCNCEIAPELDLEQSNLSRHLKILVISGVLESWKEGLRVNYRVSDERIYKILDVAGEIAKETIGKKAEMIST